MVVLNHLMDLYFIGFIKNYEYVAFSVRHLQSHPSRTGFSISFGHPMRERLLFEPGSINYFSPIEYVQTGKWEHHTLWDEAGHRATEMWRGTTGRM